MAYATRPRKERPVVKMARAEAASAFAISPGKPSSIGAYPLDVISSIMEMVPDGVIIYAPSGLLNWSNTQAASLLNLRSQVSPEGRVGLSTDHTRPPRPIGGMVKLVAEDGKPRDMLLRLPKHYGKQRAIEFRAMRFTTADSGRYVAVFLRDFSGQEEQRIQAQMYASELGTLYRDARRYSKEVESLYAVTKLLNSEMELGNMLSKAAELLDSLTSQKLTLGLAARHKSAHDFHMIATHGPRAQVLRSAITTSGTRESSLPDMLIEQSPMVFDLSRDVPPPLKRLAEKRIFASVCVLPLVTRKKKIGFLLCCSTRPFAMTVRDIPFYQGMAESLAVAIERAQLYAAKKRQLVQARELDETKRNLLGAFSHDFRTPLTALNTSMELLSDPGAVQQGSDHHRRLLAAMKRSTQRLDRLLSDLLDASQLRSTYLRLEKHPVSLEQILGDIVSLLPHGNAERIKIESSLNGAPIMGDPVRLQQALANVIDNAFKYSPTDAAVTVELSTVGKEIRVVVSDRGPGIPISERTKIFQPFYRMERDLDRNGTGLGLSICKWLVELHGGKVFVQSRPGGGSRFCISLPVGGTS